MKPVVARQSAFYFLYFLAVSQKSTTFAPVMNWKFILSWAIKFALCTVVFDFALAWTESAWLAFPMAWTNHFSCCFFVSFILFRIFATALVRTNVCLKGNQVRILDRPAAVFRLYAKQTKQSLNQPFGKTFALGR